MFIIPHGAPAGHEWFVALVVLVGLCLAVRSFMRSREDKPQDGVLRQRPDLPNPNPIRPGPGPDERLRELQSPFRAVRGSKAAKRFQSAVESVKDAPPKEQASRVHEHFGFSAERGPGRAEVDTDINGE
jgi:hypothetical protein